MAPATEEADAPVRVALKGVDKQFGSVSVLEDVSLAVEAGSVAAIVGPNGSGKTTLLQIVTGLVEPTSGTIERPTGDDRPLGYLPQHPALRGPLTVRETLEFYRALLDTSIEIGPVLETIGLASIPDRRVADLSGGMRQLLGLGIALLGDPPLLVLDEPTSGLDPRNTEHIFDVVIDIADEGTSVLWATHDLAHAAAADDLVVLNDGRIVVEASPTDLLDRTGEETLVGVFRSILGTDPTVQTGRDDHSND